MKTTEVFVEQVLIGLLVILNFGLIFFQDIGSQFKLDFQTGAAVVAVAYLVGIVFDRFADTLLEDIERHNRLRLALRHWDGESDKDPFPEGDYRMTVIQNREAFTYSNYIRTRIRLSRALAILIPGLSVSFLLGKTRCSGVPAWNAAAVSLPVIYGEALLFQLIRGMKCRGGENIGSNGKREKRELWYKPPRTDTGKHGLKTYERKRIWCLAVCEPSVWAFTFLTALAFALARWARCPALLGVPFLSIALTLLTGWTWWRITETFMTFLRDFSHAIKKETEDSAGLHNKG